MRCSLKIGCLLVLGCALVSAVSASTSRQASEAKSGGRSVTDETGRKMTIPANVQRIVSLAPNLTEVVYALGAGDRLVADTDFCDVPAEAKLKPHVGGPKNPNLEAIVALHPDVVLATTSINNAATADTLLKAGIAVYTTDPETVIGTLDSFAKIGDVIGSRAQGIALETSLRARLDALQAHLTDHPLAHVLFLVWLTPPMSIGQNTFVADALRWAGAESILITNQRWPQPAFEEVLRLQPDYVVLTTDHEGSSADVAILRTSPQWKDLMAVQLGRVVTASDGIETPAPSLVDAIEQLAHELHPEYFVDCAQNDPGAVPCGR
jgi:iron complex transport system substrate-binding protein